jgi:hypothetical protein
VVLTNLQPPSRDSWRHVAHAKRLLPPVLAESYFRVTNRRGSSLKIDGHAAISALPTASGGLRVAAIASNSSIPTIYEFDEEYNATSERKLEEM